MLKLIPYKDMNIESEIDKKEINHQREKKKDSTGNLSFKHKGKFYSNPTAMEMSTTNDNLEIPTIDISSPLPTNNNNNYKNLQPHRLSLINLDRNILIYDQFLQFLENTTKCFLKLEKIVNEIW